LLSQKQTENEKPLSEPEDWERPVFDKLTLLAIIITSKATTTTAQVVFILISNETQHANDRFIFHAVVSAVNQLGQGVD